MSIKRNLGYLASALLLLVLLSACAQDSMTEAEIKALVQAEVDKRMSNADKDSLENRLTELQLELFCVEFDLFDSIKNMPHRFKAENYAACSNNWYLQNDSSLLNDKSLNMSEKITNASAKRADIRTDLLCQHRIMKVGMPQSYVENYEQLCVPKPGGGYKSSYNWPRVVEAGEIPE